MPKTILEMAWVTWQVCSPEAGHRCQVKFLWLSTSAYLFIIHLCFRHFSVIKLVPLENLGCWTPAMTAKETVHSINACPVNYTAGSMHKEPTISRRFSHLTFTVTATPLDYIIWHILQIRPVASGTATSVPVVSNTGFFVSTYYIVYPVSGWNSF